MSTNLPNEFLNELTRGNVVLFIGGIISDLNGLPNWVDVTRPLADSIEYPLPERSFLITGDHLLRALQRYVNRHGRSGLIRYLRDKLDTSSVKPARFLELLLQLPTKTICTTNYDDLIERTLKRTSKAFDLVVTDAQLAFTSSDRVRLIKMKGSLDHPESLVITHNDHLQYSQSHKLIGQHLASMLVEKTFLFVGYEINDPSFELIHGNIAFDLQQYERNAYCILFDANASAVEDLKAQNMKVINLETNNQKRSLILESWLNALLAKMEQPIEVTTALSDDRISITQLVEEVKGLVTSLGFRILQEHKSDRNVEFVAEKISLGERILRCFWCTDGSVIKADVEHLQQLSSFYPGSTAWVITYRTGMIGQGALEVANNDDRIQICSLGTFYSRMLGFQKYLNTLIDAYKSSDIPRYWVDLVCRAPKYDETRGHITGDDHYPSVEVFLDAWLDSPTQNHISVLGDFGTGKTWLCKRYAAKLAERYLADLEHNRIPVLISLRDYAKSLRVEQLVTDVLVNGGVDLPGGFATFAQLNKSGKLLLVLDGFDEMERKVDFAIKVKNFEELAKLVTPRSKVILTCRTPYFRSNIEEKTIFVGAGKRNIDLKSRPNFDVLYLQEFDEGKIRSALEKRVPDNWLEYWQLIKKTYDLSNLAQRPIMLEMIIDTLPNLSGTGGVIDIASLYSAYTERWIKRDINSERSLLSTEDKRLFILELALEMFLTDRHAINFRELPIVAQEHFSHKIGVGGSTKLDYLDSDIRTCSYLRRDASGNYEFAHRSFYEFFVAQRVVQSIRQKDGSILDKRYLPEHIAYFVRNLLYSSDIDAIESIIEGCSEYQDTCRAQILYYYASIAGYSCRPFLQTFVTANKKKQPYLMSVQMAYNWLGRFGDNEAVLNLIDLLESNPDFRREFIDYLLYYFGGIDRFIEGTRKRYFGSTSESALAPFGKFILDSLEEYLKRPSSI